MAENGKYLQWRARAIIMCEGLFGACKCITVNIQAKKSKSAYVSSDQAYNWNACKS